jgi:hypothetical protein
VTRNSAVRSTGTISREETGLSGGELRMAARHSP